MARKPGSVEAVIDGRALHFKGSFDQDPIETDIEVDKCMDGTTVMYEMPKVSKVSGTIQLPAGTSVTDIASIRDQTLRIIVGHLKTTYPRAAVKVTGALNEKLELPIEIYPLSKPIEEVES